MITEQRLDALLLSGVGQTLYLWVPLVVFAGCLWKMRGQHLAARILSPLLLVLGAVPWIVSELVYRRPREAAKSHA